ncbi:hypothetical protein B0F90DRAFT_47943 [Multifurca ochricompacta]|uniref:Uncharacterized protein n=1 Tax=Multifurca ochricompacta TaxID=376703 RepID=A0AAD4QTD7_9AGAM|nr:hypothetical protein B0F90DRAFT_47943 [Multifurca ochricompacta]
MPTRLSINEFVIQARASTVHSLTTNPTYFCLSPGGKDLEKDQRCCLSCPSYDAVIAGFILFGMALQYYRGVTASIICYDWFAPNFCHGCLTKMYPRQNPPHITTVLPYSSRYFNLRYSLGFNENRVGRHKHSLRVLISDLLRCSECPVHRLTLMAHEQFSNFILLAGAGSVYTIH